ncbi:integrase [Pyrodictium delaneyi]|uniref:integrase n=1 Tax=Pyrodictium delaneyi TaxID=1273541 RepID=UPI0015D7C05B|nr:integrase [Pyrodictium delaneyi]
MEKIAEELGLAPSADAVLEFLAGRSPHERDHFRKALRLWLKYSGQREALELLSGGWAKTEAGGTGVSLEEALEAIRIAWGVDPRYALYLALLLITGLRPVELRSVKRSGQILPLVFAIEKPSTTTKRHSYAFLTPTALGLRDKLLGRYEKLVFWRREVEYEALKAIRERLPGFRPYALRALNAELLLRGGVPEAIIDYIQGRAPETVLRKHYLHKQMTRQEMLLDILGQHNKALRDVDEWLRGEILSRV